MQILYHLLNIRLAPHLPFTDGSLGEYWNGQLFQDELQMFLITFHGGKKSAVSALFLKISQLWIANPLMALHGIDLSGPLHKILARIAYVFWSVGWP
jgi:hypothetical protein